MEPYNCTVICPGPLFCPVPVVSPRHVTSLGQRFCDLHPNNDTSICFTGRVKIPLLCVFSLSGRKS